MNYSYYIHRSAIGYLTNGTSWPGQPGSPMDPGGIENQVQQYINQRFGQKMKGNLAGRRAKVSEIENKYQRMLFEPAVTQSDMATRQILKQALDLRLSEAFNNAAGSVNINDLASVAAAGGSAAPYAEQLKNSISGTLKQISNKEKITEGRLKTIAQEIQRRIDTIAKNQQSLEALQADFEKVSGDFQKFRNNIAELAEGLQAGSGKFIFPNSDLITLESLKAMINLIGDNKAMLAANQTGAIGEWLVPMLNYSVLSNLNVAVEDMTEQVQKDLVEQLANVMMQFNLGGTTVDMVINPQGQIIRDSKARDKDSQGLSLTMEEQSAGCKVIHRVNKTDAYFYVNDSEASREDISVKNYSSLNKISLVSNTPLNFIIDQIGGASGHVKNILVHHPVDDNLIAGYRAAVNAQIMKLILCFALVGYSEQNQPSIFMVISNKKVYCLDMDSVIAELIASTVDSSGSYAIAYNGTVGGVAGAAISFNAGWGLDSSVDQPVHAPTPEDRVNAALANFEAQKIHATLSIQLAI